MANNYEITHKWVGGKDGHYEVYVNGQFNESCDEAELNGVLRRLEAWYSSNETLRRELSAWCSKVLEAKESDCMVNTFQMIRDIDQIIAKAFDHEPVFINLYC